MKHYKFKKKKKKKNTPKIIIKGKHETIKILGIFFNEYLQYVKESKLGKHS